MGHHVKLHPNYLEACVEFEPTTLWKEKIYEILQYLMIFLIFIIIPKETELGTFAA